MENSIDILQKLLQFTIDEFEICPWIQDLSFDKIIEELKSEIFEVQQAKSIDELSSELGDLFRDVILTIFVAIRDNDGIQFDKIIENNMKKIRTRKPFVVNKKRVTKQEAIDIWDKIKRKEKEKEPN